MCVSEGKLVVQDGIFPKVGGCQLKFRYFEILIHKRERTTSSTWTIGWIALWWSINGFSHSKPQTSELSSASFSASPIMAAQHSPNAVPCLATIVRFAFLKIGRDMLRDRNPCFCIALVDAHYIHPKIIIPKDSGKLFRDEFSFRFGDQERLIITGICSQRASPHAWEMVK